MPREKREIKLIVCQGEPLASLAAQRLHDSGIRCVVRSLGLGPGVWGLAADLPCAIYVSAADEINARWVLDLPSDELFELDKSLTGRLGWRAPLLVVLAVVAMVALIQCGGEIPPAYPFNGGMT